MEAIDGTPVIDIKPVLCKIKSINAYFDVGSRSVRRKSDPFIPQHLAAALPASAKMTLG